MKREQKIPVGPGGAQCFGPVFHLQPFTVQQSASLPAARLPEFGVRHMTNKQSKENILSQMHKSVGIAVFACQALELTFVLCVKLVFKQSHVNELQQVDSLNKNSFRPPTKALLNELAKCVEIDNHFSDTLSNIVDRRHELIHRWGLNNKFPVVEDDVGNKKLIEFSNKLSIDANGVSEVLISYVCEWFNRFPEMRDTLEILRDKTLPITDRIHSLKIQKAEQLLPGDG